MTELRLTDARDAQIIKNLWPLYVHDLSEFASIRPNVHGLLHDGAGPTTLTEQGETLNGWWSRPDSLFPYLIRVDGRPAGFNLIAARPSLPEGIDADFVVHEFFVLHAFRGKEVAEQAAAAGLLAHPGRWEIVTYPEHARAIAFWRRVLNRHRPGAVSERETDHVWGRKVCFRFESSG